MYISYWTLGIGAFIIFCTIISFTETIKDLKKRGFKKKSIHLQNSATNAIFFLLVTDEKTDQEIATQLDLLLDSSGYKTPVFKEDSFISLAKNLGYHNIVFTELLED